MVVVIVHWVVWRQEDPFIIHNGGATLSWWKRREIILLFHFCCPERKTFQRTSATLKKKRFRFLSPINNWGQMHWGSSGFHWRKCDLNNINMLISLMIPALCTTQTPSVTTHPICPLNSYLFLLLCLYCCNSRITAVILWINHLTWVSI